MPRPSAARPISDAPTPISDLCELIATDEGRRLRPWNKTDAPILTAAWSDEDIARWNPVPPTPDEAFAEKWINGTGTQHVASIGIDVVMVNSADTVMGELGFQVDPARSVAEVGFWLAREFRQRGHGTSLLGFAGQLAHALELRGLIALVAAENVAATGLLENCGWSEVETTTTRRAFALWLSMTERVD